MRDPLVIIGVAEGALELMHSMMQDENGNKLTWGGEGTPNEEIWGPQGWCEAEQPSIRSVIDSHLL